ncbi:alpha-N-acetylglucosaminidase [Parafilimonas sp.]|uniref:alpha-N-acetylglucosaminidase n=1 Tax=Parafilimonas sp. TaxID=1969739 RepID=UPI0039E619C8
MKQFPLFLFVCIILCNQVLSQVSQTAIRGLLQRTVPSKAAFFSVEEIAPENGKDVFELESRGNKIILRGSNGVSVASALNYYLRNYCNCLITWNGSNLKLPEKLPVVATKVHKVTPYMYRYYLNYCTFNYTMSWWDWERWQKEIDWMALNGINTPLSITGEEAIWREVYTAMGFTRADIDRFFTGPAYFAWGWMGNIDGWGGPLPRHWIDTHKELQKKIVKAERELGMKPVLPAFTGHVPPAFTEKFPQAHVKKTNWGAGFDDVYILDANDSLFEEIGAAFLKAQTKEYGTDHLYSADTFNENLPPSNDSAYLNDISKKVFASMAAYDPKAVWVMQGWMFHYQSTFWQPTQIKALLNAIPNDHMIMLDLYSEAHPLWQQTAAYYGKPWIWNQLHNFGGNISLWGRMSHVANDPSAALNDNGSGKMAGIGLAPEGIEQNPALYQLMIDNVWRSDAIDINTWLQQYVQQRYGTMDETLYTAWQILEKTVYNGGLGEGGPESILVARPTLEKQGHRVLTKLDYDPMELVKAWELFVKSADNYAGNDGFHYDLTDITRQVLANYANVLQQKFADAYNAHNRKDFELYSNSFLTLLDDLDNLLNTRTDFLLGRWIRAARSNGITTEEQNLYEKNARDQVTLWGDKESELHEYANKQWAGLVKDFYKPRWQLFFKYMGQGLSGKDTLNTKAFEEEVKNREWKWVNSTNEKYAYKASGNSIQVVKDLYSKYISLVKQP